jgi:diguanylate cyclase (GGDEF)-like protein
MPIRDCVPTLAPRSGLGLRVASWAVLLVGVGMYMVAPAADSATAKALETYSMGVFFVLVAIRIGLAAVRQPARRKSLLLLLLGVLLWAAGSADVNGASQGAVTTFPARGEFLFLTSYAGIAGFLILDVAKRVTNAAATWLETIVICGGAVCLAGSLLVTPAAGQLGREDLRLLLALLYPLIDIILFLVVIAQVALHARGRLIDNLGLTVGFASLAVADSGFLLHRNAVTYQYSVVSIALWGVGFALIADSACRARPRQVEPQSARGLTFLVVLAGLAAGFVLAFQENGTIRDYLVWPALGTLCAAGMRLGIALRAAQRTAEAIELSLSDDLTVLPNRRAVLALLDARLATDAPVSLMILDLDGFKEINDTLGHGAGDAVLRAVAGRMREAVDAKVMIARLGGDEFAALVLGQDEGYLMKVANDMLEAVREPQIIDGITLSTNASIGVTVRQPTDHLSSELLRRADVAMYDAKHRRAGVTLYDVRDDDFSRDKLRLADELRLAIVNHQLVLWYQPQIDAPTGQVCGLEALVRWVHPVHGLLAPDTFLPVARRVGLMQSMSEEIGRIAVADLVRWQKMDLRPRLAINCAPPELMSGIFLPRLKAILLEANVSPEQIVIELTEESFLSEPQRARALLMDVREDGFQVSIDDYGTGFSSLSYLRDLPVQELKIDRSFVSMMLTDPRSRMIIASTFQMAAALGLRTVAEGVEDAQTAAALIDLGADVLQGYHLGRPMPPDRIEPWIRENAYALI